MVTKAKTIMLQGTSSDVGKSLLCTALCRIFKQDGFKVAPFKAQNMALSSYFTPDGEEISNAQAIQAQAAGVVPQARMNPILLKPKGDMTSDVIVMGKKQGTMSAQDYRNKFLPLGATIVEQCITSLKKDFGLLVIEGAGSPVEINLKDRDIVNMKTAELADAPVVLVADIDRGGVFAAIIGTLALLEPQERQRVKGLIINKFRGDISLLQAGLEFIEERTDLPVLGVIPCLDSDVIPQENTGAMLGQREVSKAKDRLDIVVVELPRSAGFSDFQALQNIPKTTVRYVALGESLDSPDVIILPSTKNTITDLQALWHEGTAWQIIEAQASGATIVGIGGGYQMLGEKLQIIADGAINEQSLLPGLGLLDIQTVLKHPSENTGQKRAKVVGTKGFWSQLTSLELTGYGVNCGQISYGPMVEPIIKTIEQVVGVASTNSDIWGTTLQGLFENYQYTLPWINYLRHKKGLTPLELEQLPHLSQDSFDLLADHIRQHLDMTKIYQIIGN